MRPGYAKKVFLFLLFVVVASSGAAARLTIAGEPMTLIRVFCADGSPVAGVTASVMVFLADEFHESGGAWEELGRFHSDELGAIIVTTTRGQAFRHRQYVDVHYTARIIHNGRLVDVVSWSATNAVLPADIKAEADVVFEHEQSRVIHVMLDDFLQQETENTLNSISTREVLISSVAESRNLSIGELNFTDKMFSEITFETNRRIQSQVGFRRTWPTQSNWAVAGTTTSSLSRRITQDNQFISTPFIVGSQFTVNISTWELQRQDQHIYNLWHPVERWQEIRVVRHDGGTSNMGESWGNDNSNRPGNNVSYLPGGGHVNSRQVDMQTQGSFSVLGFTGSTAITSSAAVSYRIRNECPTHVLWMYDAHTNWRRGLFTR